MTSEKAVVKSNAKISSVWFIPILALLLGAYMVMHSWMTEGPEIEISFTTATGLEQGKTKIKYRNVDMGVVEKVRLNDNYDGVVATAKLDRQAAALLREDTRFWVVTARVGIDRISGLDTLLSGAYLQLSPGTGEDGRRQFEALEEPPLTPTDADGLRLKLTSSRTTSVSTGDAVVYQGFKVGRVESVKFDPTSRLVHYVIFVDAPYHELVNSSVRFWDVSGIAMSAGTEGVQIDMGSLDTVFLGGISFGTPPGIDEGETVEHNAEFRLYESYEDILKNPFKFGTYFVVSFSQSIKGLQPGAPVEYRGIPIGRVERLLLRETMKKALAAGLEGSGDPIPVLIYLEPARLELPDSQASVETLQHAIETGVTNGMRGSLESGNLLTGAKFVSIDYYPNEAPAEMGEFLGYTTIPTIETGLGQLQHKLASLLDKFGELPLDETITTANEALGSMDEALGSLNDILVANATQQLPGELEQTLRDLQSALEGLSPGSGVYQSLDSTLLKLNQLLGNLEAVTGTLKTNPSAAILPSKLPTDPLPEASK